MKRVRFRTAVLERSRALRFKPSVGGMLAVLSLAATAGHPGVEPALAQGGNTITVSSSAELAAALSPENTGRRIVVQAGSYTVNEPLKVPDGTVLEGEGVMLFDDAGLPGGFAAGTRTTLTMASNTSGSILTLGNGVTVRGLEVVDLPGRSGNAIAVVSRNAGDRVSATIAETEIVSPNRHLSDAQGPTGCGVVALTANPPPNLADDPPPHEGAAITALMVRSLISPAPGNEVRAV